MDGFGSFWLVLLVVVGGFWLVPVLVTMIVQGYTSANHHLRSRSCLSVLFRLINLIIII